MSAETKQILIDIVESTRKELERLETENVSELSPKYIKILNRYLHHATLLQNIEKEV